MGLAVGAVLVALGTAIALGSSAPRAGAVRVVDLGAAPLGERVIACGLAAFAATPVVRVVALVANYARDRDRRFVALAGVVVAILAVAIISGLRTS